MRAHIKEHAAFRKQVLEDRLECGFMVSPPDAVTSPLAPVDPHQPVGLPDPLRQPPRLLRGGSQILAFRVEQALERGARLPPRLLRDPIRVIDLAATVCLRPPPLL